MNDTELERLASNNPALTIPASSSLYKSTSNGRSAERGQRLQSREATRSTSQASSDTTVDASTSFEDVSKYDRGWRRVVRNFSPSWFSLSMGTGVVSLIFITIPFKANWLYWLSVVFFILNLLIFTLATVISLLRYTLYPAIWSVMIHDPNNSLFLGTAPMGFATIIESLIFLCCPYWGPWATTLAWALWMLDSMASIAVTVSLSFVLISQTHIQSLDRITAAQLLPIAATIVASGTGGEVAHALLTYNNQPWYALGTTLTSYVMWGMSTPFAMVVLVIYYQRLAVHKLPSREIIVSSFLPLGPLGMGGYTIAYLGAQMRAILPAVQPFLSHVAIAGDFLYLIGIFLALLMFAFGLVWFVFAVAAIYSCGSFPFSMGWWGFVFPLGVFAISTMQLGIEFPSLFFRVLGTVFGVMVVLLWIVVMAGTAKGAWKGHLFYAPCLKNLPQKAKHGNCVESQAEPGPDEALGDIEKQ